MPPAWSGWSKIRSKQSFVLQEVCRHLSACANRREDHPMPFFEQFEYLYFPLLDTETENVLLYMDQAFERVSTWRAEGKNVLVHCTQGVSRSAAIVAGFIMKSQQMDFDNAYKQLRAAYPQANMADNFKEQLRQYGSIFQWSMLLNTQPHRLYRTKERITFSSSLLQVRSSDQARHRFLCRKCRFALFLDDHIIPSTCENHRVECMEWMDSQTSNSTSGSLNCPSCQSKLGQFNWQGLLGEYDIPGFVVTKSKVDKMPLSSSFKGEGFPKTKY